MRAKKNGMKSNGFQIISNSDGTYEGNVRKYKRHGYGIQKWNSGEIFKGTWKNDKQMNGMFQDLEGRLWKGNFSAKKIRLVYEPSAAISPRRRKKKLSTSIPVASPYKSAEARADLKLMRIEAKLAKLERKSAEKKAQSIARLNVKDLPETQTPGPTSYSPHIVGLSSPKFSMSKRVWAPNDIQERDSTIPGPSDYDPDDSSLLKNVPSALKMDCSGRAAGYSSNDPRSPKMQTMMAEEIQRKRNNLKINALQRAELGVQLTSPRNRDLTKCIFAGHRSLKDNSISMA